MKTPTQKLKMNDEEIIMEIYRRMFKEAEPSADVDKIIKSGEGKQRNFFMKYYLNQKRQDEIIEEVCKENKKSRSWEINSFKTTCILGSSPTGIRETMLKERKQK